MYRFSGARKVSKQASVILLVACESFVDAAGDKSKVKSCQTYLVMIGEERLFK